MALGHPIGASGARILTTLLHAMKQRDAKTGHGLAVPGRRERGVGRGGGALMADPYFPTVAVVGAGTMGNGIAQTFASYGTEVRLLDVNEAALERGVATVEKSLGRFVKKEKLTQAQADEIRARLKPSTRLEDAGDAPLVVRGRRRARRGQAGGLRGARLDHARQVDPRDEHLVDLDHRDRGLHRPRRPGDRHALHEPGAADDIGRGDPRPGDLRRHDRDGRGLLGVDRQDPGRGERLPGLRLQPRPDADDQRGGVLPHGRASRPRRRSTP